MKKITQIIIRMAAVLVLCSTTITVLAQGAVDYDAVNIQTIKVVDNIYMLTGSGGNMGVLTGADGAILIDDQFAQLTDKIKQAVAAVSDKPIRFLINTHWHGDHVGGNENLGKDGVIIVAHDNVHQRMSMDTFMELANRTIPAAPEQALPIISFSDSMTFRINGEEAIVKHLKGGHTDGDSIIHFRNANVIHSGDLVFNGSYPVIDTGSGGSINGMIEGGDYILSISDAETRIIPGHGQLGDRSIVQTLRDLLVTARDRVQRLIDEGKTLEQIQALKPNADYDAAYGKGFVNADTFLQYIYTSLTAQD